MLVREVMSSPAITVHRTDPVRQAIRILHGNDITAAPVLDDLGCLVGVVSELDLLRGEFEPDPRATVRPARPAQEPPPRRVTEVMTGDVITVTETTDVTTAIELMVGRRIKSLPVLRGHEIVGVISRRVDAGGRLVGIVSRHDLIKVFLRSDKDIEQQVREAVRADIAGLDVTVTDAVVTLSGTLAEHSHAITAVRLAENVDGVVTVHDSLNWKHDDIADLPVWGGA